MPLQYRAAAAADLEALLEWVERLYREDAITFQAETVRRGIAALLAEPANGEALLWRDGSDQTIGYTVMTACFSLERGGRYGLLDELYLAPPARGRGYARPMLAAVAERARARGYTHLCLEVNRHNAAAAGLYLRQGYLDLRRDVLQLALDVPPMSGAGA